MGLFYALFLTLVIESLVMLALTRSKKWVYYNLLCNLVTNPTLNILLIVIAKITDNFYEWIFESDFNIIYYICVAIGEVLVVIGEAHLYRAMTGETRGKCYIRSLVTNGASFFIGLLLM